MSKYSAFTESNSFAPAVESIEGVSVKKRNELYINGAWHEPEEARYIKTQNPATGEVLSEIAVGGERDIDTAVKAARIAYEGEWSMISGAERGKLLFQLARRIQECSKELALIETLDGGKPIRESRDVDLPLVASHFFYHAGWAP